MTEPQDHDRLTFDTRVTDHARRRGTLDQKAYQAWLDSLPDEADEAEPSKVAFTTPYADRLARERGSSKD